MHFVSRFETNRNATVHMPVLDDMICAVKSKVGEKNGR